MQACRQVVEVAVVAQALVVVVALMTLNWLQATPLGQACRTAVHMVLLLRHTYEK